MNVAGLAKVMEEFEQTFQEFDVKEEVMGIAMNQAMATSTSTEAVEDFLRQLADENDLDIRPQIDAISTISHPIVILRQEEIAAHIIRLAALDNAT